jgi:hypothetical protein
MSTVVVSDDLMADDCKKAESAEDVVTARNRRNMTRVRKTPIVRFRRARLMGRVAAGASARLCTLILLFSDKELARQVFA